VWIPVDTRAIFSKIRVSRRLIKNFGGKYASHLFYVGRAAFLLIKVVKTIPEPIISIPLELIRRLKLAFS
jgi:hypothetical protein